MDPANFPGNPNPPPKAPEPAKTPVSPTGPSTSAGTGALPPSKSNLAGATPLAPASDSLSYSVSDRGVFAFSDADAKRVGDVTLAKDDADKLLKNSGADFDEARGTYDNVPEDVVKALTAGPQSLTSEIKQRFNAGLADFHRASLGVAVANGEISAADARERWKPDLVEAQFAQKPGSAWKGLGDALHKFMQHPVDEGEDILRQSVLKTAQALPSLADILNKATLGTVAGGAVGLLGGPLAPATVPMGMELGGAAGTFMALYHQELGGRIANMADQGLDDEQIKKKAPMAAAASAVGAGIFMYGVDAMAAPFKGAFLKGLAESEPAQKIMASWAYNYGVNAGVKMPALGAVHQMVSDLADNMSALVDQKPEMMKSAKDFGRNAVQAAVDMAEISAVAGVPGAILEGVTDQSQRPTSPAGEPLSSQASEGLNRESAGPAGQKEMGSSTPGQASTSNSSSSPESITPESVKVKAEDEARPVLEKYAKEAGRDATDPAFAKELFQEHNDAIHRAKRDMGMTKDIPDMTPEDRVAFAQRLKEMTPEEQARIEKAFFESGPVVDALLRKVNIDISPENAEALAKSDAEKAAKAGAPPPAEPPTPPAGGGPGGEGEAPKEREFFKNPDINVKPLETDKATAKNIRAQYVGDRDEQVARINQKMRAFKKAVPDELDRRAAAWWVDAGGDRAQLAEALQNPKLKEYHAEIERALNLPENAQRWAETAQRYFKEAAEVGAEKGTLNATRENYVNRLYQPEKEGDFVQGGGSASGVSRSTSHAKERVFETMADAAAAGKKFATTDLADLVTTYNSEIARANSARAMADSMVDAGLGAWKQEKNVPAGWEQVGNLQKDVPIKDKEGEAVIGEDGNQVHSRSVFVAPKGIADGLKAIAEPNFARKIDALRGIQRYQGLVKTIDLSFSFFHHLSMVAQLAYAGNFSDMLKVGNLDKFLDAPDFNEREQDFVRHGGTTAITSDNADILRKLTQQEGDTFSKIVNLPGVKQVLEQTDKNANFLFGKIQRLWKVNTFSQLAADWVGKHPDATPEEHVDAMRELSQHVNDRFGGQNWEAMGMTKSNMSLLRIGLLAPDWTISNLHLLKSAIGEGGAGGRASRVHVLSSLMVGMAATEGLNYALTGHFTDENKKGHELEVELAPDVYVSMLRGGVQDITKLASMVAESGLAGVSRFSQGKLSPFARTGVGLLTNTQYTGRQIAKKGEGPVANTYDVLKFALGSATPMPLGISNLMQYAQSEEPSIGGGLAVASGVGRYSQGKGGK